MTIENGGDVGIGVSDQTEKLKVAGSVLCGTSTGKAQIGTLHGNGWAAFANSNRFRDANYALIQNDAGITYLNALRNQHIGFSHTEF